MIAVIVILALLTVLVATEPEGNLADSAAEASALNPRLPQASRPSAPGLPAPAVREILRA